MTDPDRFEQITKQIANGQSIDWSSLRAEMSVTPTELQLLESFASMCRSHESSPHGEALERGFDIQELLGEGGAAQVYRATDRLLGRQVALKVIQSGHPLVTAESFLREARMLAALEHPNIVRIYGVNTLEDTIRLSLELIEGESLDRVLKRSGPFSAQEAARIGLDLCGAFAAIHGAGLIHLDLKPANVMRARGGRIVLLDFGVARSRQPEDSPARLIGGTPLYMAPEQLRGSNELTPAADIYALGVLLYCLATAHQPFEGYDSSEVYPRILQGEGRPLLDLRPDLPAQFVRIVDRAMAKDPAARFRSAGDMAKSLSSFLAEQGSMDAPETPGSVQASERLFVRIRPGRSDPEEPVANEIFIDARQIESGGRRDLARVALERGPRAFVAGAGSVDTIVLRPEPTLDDLLAAAIVERKLTGQPVPQGIGAFAEYAAASRAGIRPVRAVPLERSLEGTFAAMRRLAGPDLSDPATWERFARRWRVLSDRIFEAAASGLEPDVCLSEKESLFDQERAFLERDREVYEEDVRRGFRWKLRLPSGTAGRGLLLVRPRSMLFKYWSREREAEGKRSGGDVLVVSWGEGRWVISINPALRISLQGLHEALQLEESEKSERQGMDAGSWFDGGPFAHSLVAAPEEGTKLSMEDVMLVLWRWSRAPWSLRQRAGATRRVRLLLKELREE
ncbi:MAG: serine/threonine-protein kinase [Planctomycetota bacterium]